MDLVKVGSFSNPAATGNFDITDVGFEPSAIYVWQINNIDNIALAYAHGAADSAGNQWATSAVAVGRTAQARNGSTSHLFYRTSTSTETLNVVGTLVTMLPNGFRVNFSTAVWASTWGYIAFNKKVSAKVGNFTSAAGVNSVTGIGFKPQGMITSWITFASTIIAQAIGFVGTDLSQFGYSGGNDTGTGSYNANEVGNALMVASSARSGAGNVQSWDNDGFTYNMTAGGGFVHGYLVFGGGLTAKVGQLTTPTAGNTTTVSGLGFDLQGLMTFPNINAVTTYGFPIGLGVADRNLNQSFTGTGGYSGAANNMTRYGSIGNAIGRTGYGVADIRYLGALTSIGTGSFTVNNSIAGGGGETFQYFAFGWDYTDKTQTGRVSVKATLDKPQTGRTRIQALVSRTIQGLSRIQKSFSQTVTGQTRIQKNIDQDQYGVVSILANTRQEQTGLVSIVIHKFRDITGRIRISVVQDRTQPGRIRIQTDTTRHQNGLVRIYRIVERAITGRTRVSKTIDVDQPGKVWIGAIQSRNQNGVIRILNRVVFAGRYKPDGMSSGELLASQPDTGIAIKPGSKDNGEITVVELQEPGFYKKTDKQSGQFK